MAGVDTRLTPELRDEGLAREVVNRLQRYRKEAGLAVADQVELWLDGTPGVLEAVRAHLAYVAEEVQAIRIHVAEALPAAVDPLQVTFAGEDLVAAVVVGAS